MVVGVVVVVVRSAGEHEGVHGHRAGGPGHQRVDVERLEVVAELDRESGHGDDGGQRLEVGRRGPRPVEQRPDPQPVEQPAGAGARSSGGSATARSARTSTRTPPAASTTTGPSSGSSATPTESSTPAGAVALTSTRGPSRAARSS